MLTVLSPRVCLACGSTFSPTDHRRRRCDDCGIVVTRVPDVPCASCGVLMWGGATSLPPGQRRCLPCRRKSPAKAPANAPRLVTCWCGTLFETRHPTRKACSTYCSRAMDNRRKRKPLPLGRRRSGPGYDALKARVRAEEPNCWWCDGPIDQAYPHPRSFAMDHVVPISKGGALLDRANVRASHMKCNLERGARCLLVVV